VDSIAITRDQSVTDITDHLAEVRERVANAASAAGRDADAITIIAVSKRHPVASIRSAYDAGQRDFGENFVQEAVAKIEALDLPDVRWHFIGHIQGNKTKDIARCFDWVHTVDRLKIAQRLNDQRPHYAAPLNVCIQVNLAKEPQKSGIPASELPVLASDLRLLPRLRLRGLMTIPPADADAAAVRTLFDALRELQNQLVQQGFELDTLSMGMSADLELAVQSGSTMVRIGTAIFGARS
jgi:pyridoxal phosphate enzyme (YggS family)